MDSSAGELLATSYDSQPQPPEEREWLDVVDHDEAAHVASVAKTADHSLGVRLAAIR